MLIKGEGNRMKWLCGQIMVNSCTTTKNKGSTHKGEPPRLFPVTAVGVEVAVDEHFDIVGRLG